MYANEIAVNRAARLSSADNAVHFTPQPAPPPMLLVTPKSSAISSQKPDVVVMEHEYEYSPQNEFLASQAVRHTTPAVPTPSHPARPVLKSSTSAGSLPATKAVAFTVQQEARIVSMWPSSSQSPARQPTVQPITASNVVSSPVSHATPAPQSTQRHKISIKSPSGGSDDAQYGNSVAISHVAKMETMKQKRLSAPADLRLEIY